jgi:hypothetical protein
MINAESKLQQAKEHLLKERGKEIEWEKNLDKGTYKIRIPGRMLCELPEEYLDDNDLEHIIRSISNSF